MPRRGQNPLKWTAVKKRPERVTVLSLVYLPELNGFWQQGLDVLKLCLNSLHSNTTVPFDFMVLDNGSSPEVRDYLLDAHTKGLIQFLILSTYNLRKLGGMNLLLASAPGEIVAFADSDVYFRPGWLEKSIEILEAFPEAGQVSALPTADKTNDYCNNTHKQIRIDPTLSIQTAPNLIPAEYIDAHRISIGKTRKSYSKSLGDRMDTFITRNNVGAYVSAQDFQFTTRREVIQKVLPLQVTSEEDYYDPIYSPVFEKRVDELGYWRLSTSDYLVHHIGNQVPTKESDFEWIYQFENSERLGNPVEKTEPMIPQKRFLSVPHFVLGHDRLRPFLKRINAWTYSLLYER